MRRALSAAAVLGLTAFVVAACGGRSPLDEVIIGADAGAPTDATIADDAAAPHADATVDAGPLACAGCVVGTCSSQILSCIEDPACIGILECATTTCLGLGGDAGRLPSSGGLDASCLLGCLTKNTAGALAVIGIFSCVSGTCGSDCGSVLGGLGSLGGLGGLIGGGSASSGGGGKLPEDQLGPIDADAFREVFSPLVVRSAP